MVQRGVDLLAGAGGWRFERSRTCRWEQLGSTPPRIETGNAVDNALQEMRLSRTLLTLTRLAVRCDARPDLVQRVVDYADQGIGLHDATRDAWRQYKFRLLVVLIAPTNWPQHCAWMSTDDAVPPPGNCRWDTCSPNRASCRKRLHCSRRSGAGFARGGGPSSPGRLVHGA